MPELQGIFATVAIMCHPYERLAFLQNVFAIILLLARKDVGKLFEDTLSSKIRKKEQADQ